MSIHQFLILVCILACGSEFPFACAAETKAIKWQIRSEPIKGARGQTVKVQLFGEIPPGFHTYSTKVYGAGVAAEPTIIKVNPEAFLMVSGKIEYSEPMIKNDDVAEIEFFENSVTYTIPIKIDAAASPGELKASLSVFSQLCNDKICLRPRETTLDFSVLVTDAPVITGTDPASPDKNIVRSEVFGTQDDLQNARKDGLWAYLWISLASGATALLTPCVFPMIPITVSFFTKRKHISRRRSIRDAGIYSLGIIFTFTGLGFLFALALGATGIRDFATNPWVNLAIASVFVLLALSLFGLFEIQLPTGVLNRLNASANEGEGVWSVLLMGLVFSLTSFTCTVPFVGAVMLYATRGEWLWPLLGMLAFSSVFAAPFFVLALFPSALKSLPKSGGWLNSVKVIMGFLEIAAAMKFVSNADLSWRWGLLTREIFLLGWIILALLSSFYLLGKIRFTHDTRVERLGGMRVLSSMAFLALALYLINGLLGADLGKLAAFAPPKLYPGQKGELNWGENWQTGLSEAKLKNKPIFVDFTGYTCTNCREMEETVFTRPEVSALLKQFVLIKLYTDGRKDLQDIESSSQNAQLQEKRFDSTTLPFYAIISSDDQDLLTFPDGFTRDIQKFTGFLKQGLEKAALVQVIKHPGN